MSAELRPILVELNNLTRPDGSAVYSQGNTVFQSAVYGPGEVVLHKEIPEKATLEVVYKRTVQSKESTPEMKVIQEVIRKTLETILYTHLHPRTSISVVIQELQRDGSLLASSINSVCCALLDAAIPMRCSMAAASVTIGEKGELILDANNAESEGAKAELTFVFESINKSVVSISTKGTFSPSQFRQCFSLCKEASREIFDFYRSSVANRFSDNENTEQ